MLETRKSKKQNIPNQFCESHSNPTAHASRPWAALSTSFRIICMQLHVIIGIRILKQLSIHVVISACISWWNYLHIFPKYIPQSLENLNLIQTLFSCIIIFSSPHEFFSFIYLLGLTELHLLTYLECSSGLPLLYLLPLSQTPKSGTR